MLVPTLGLLYQAVVSLDSVCNCTATRACVEVVMSQEFPQLAQCHWRPSEFQNRFFIADASSSSTRHKRGKLFDLINWCFVWLHFHNVWEECQWSAVQSPFVFWTQSLNQRVENKQCCHQLMKRAVFLNFWRQSGVSVGGLKFQVLCGKVSSPTPLTISSTLEKKTKFSVSSWKIA